MKVSKAQAAENRQAIIEAASRQIRARGIGQINVAEVAQAAGLTHGALYNHFPSRGALTAEALTFAFEECSADFSGLSAPNLLRQYLSKEHRDTPEHGCPMAALAANMPHQGSEAQEAFCDGMEGFIGLAAKSLNCGTSKRDRDRAVLAVAALVGALALARAVKDVNTSASENILRAVRDELDRLTDAGASVKK
jgi:TetR/AcrR family transcriptional repressor of nem operon